MTDRLAIQFSTSKAWQSAVIRTVTHSPFSHVSIVLPDGTLLDSSDSPDAPVISGNPRGVAIRPSDYEAFGIKRQAIFAALHLALPEMVQPALGRSASA